ncbi:MAG: SGNH/GDSL hydrolase family protein [Candidatus Omnitrophica bacterium]|nr:SGNH/GDSL hydrolase family protein [Candidatus Omnitrophota bacterium]
MKKALFTLIMVLLTVVTVAVIAEVAFRVRDLFDRNVGLKNSMGHADKKYSHVFNPNSQFRNISSRRGEYDVNIHINNYGFRGGDIEFNKEPGTTRIMAVGDSFTFGVGSNDNETIPALVEQDLRDENVSAEVINAGFGNYSPLLNYLRLRDEYLEFKPDLVLLFFDFSDLADVWRGERSLIYDKAGNILRCDPSYVNGRYDWWLAMRSHSRLCSYIHNKLIRTIEKIRILGLAEYIKAKLAGKRAKALIVAKENDYFKTRDPVEYDGYLMIRGRDRLPYIEKHFERVKVYLGKIKELLDERNIPMILVIYPYGIHVGPDQWGEGRAYWGFEKGRVYDDYYAFDMLEKYARDNDIPSINLLPVFLKNKEKKLFFDVDGHFTPEANHIAARTIAADKEFRRIINKID